MHTSVSAEELKKSAFRCSVGNPDDYGFDAPKRKSDTDEQRSPEKIQQSFRNSAATYHPAAINRQKNRDHKETKEMGKNVDIIETQIHRPGEGEGEGEADANLPEDAATRLQNCKYSRYKARRYGSHSDGGKWQDEENLDSRWKPRREACEGLGMSEYERKCGMVNVLRPYGHDICTWYSFNKPTKIQPPIIHEGKRSRPEWHFSNL